MSRSSQNQKNPGGSEMMKRNSNSSVSLSSSSSSSSSATEGSIGKRSVIIAPRKTRSKSQYEQKAQNSEMEMKKPVLEKNEQKKTEESVNLPLYVAPNSTFTLDETRNQEQNSDEVNTTTTTTTTTTQAANGRPQRAAKLKGEKKLKEPSLKSKIRQADGGKVIVKLEHEQRSSQMHEKNNSSVQAKTVTLEMANETKNAREMSRGLSDSIVEVSVKRISTITLDNSLEDEGETATIKRNTTTTTTTIQETKTTSENNSTNDSSNYFILFSLLFFIMFFSLYYVFYS